MGQVIENIQTGTTISSLPQKEIEERITTALDAYGFMGYDYSFFSYENLSSLARHLKYTFGKLTDKEITYLLANGLSGEYGKNPREIKGYNIIGWIKEYMKLRTQEVIRNDHDDNHLKINTQQYMSKYPMGKAILMKMDHVHTKDWDRIDTKELAKVINDKGTDAALDFIRTMLGNGNESY